MSDDISNYQIKLFNLGDNFGNSNNNNGPFGGKQNNVFGGGGFGNKNNPFNRNQGKQTPTIKDMTTPQIMFVHEINWLLKP